MRVSGSFGGIAVGERENWKVGVVREADGDELGGAVNGAAPIAADILDVPGGGEELVMAVGDEFAAGRAPLGTAVEAVFAGFEVHNPAVGFAVGVGVLVAVDVGMA